jgi:hypothetical protein
MPEIPEIPEELPLADAAEVSAELPASAPVSEAPEIVLGETQETAVTEEIPVAETEEIPLAANEEVAEIAKENEPMLEVHDPHESIHTWKDFFIHIATISVGLLIAVGLEQGVEALHRHHQRQVLLEELRQETLINRERGEFNLAYIERDMYWLLELHRRVDAVRRGGDKNLFVYPPPPEGYPGDPHHSDRRLQAVTVWNTAQETMHIDLLPTFDAQMYTTFYRVNDLYSDNFTALTVDWRKLTDFEFRFEDSVVPTQPDIRRMSAQELDQYAEIISGLFLEARMVRRYLQIDMAYNQAAVEHRTFPDIERYLVEHPSALTGE